MIHYIMNSTSYPRRCVALPMLHDISNTALHHQRWTTSLAMHDTPKDILPLAFHYFANTASHHQYWIKSLTLHPHQPCVTPATLHFINDLVHHQQDTLSSSLNYFINATLLHQRNITNYFINASLHHQCYIA